MSMLRNALIVLCTLSLLAFLAYVSSPPSSNNINRMMDNNSDSSSSILSDLLVEKKEVNTKSKNKKSGKKDIVDSTSDSPIPDDDDNSNGKNNKNNNNNNSDSATTEEPSSSSSSIITLPPLRESDYTLPPQQTYVQLPAVDAALYGDDKASKKANSDKPRAVGGWERRLNTPTYVGCHLGFWWIVDSWHHRVLYRKRQPDETDADLDKESDFVSGWKKLKVANDSWMIIPHSIATDNRSLILIETSIGGSWDGREHSILVFEKLQRSHPLRKTPLDYDREALKAEQQQQQQQQKSQKENSSNNSSSETELQTSPPPPPKMKSNGADENTSYNFKKSLPGGGGEAALASVVDSTGADFDVASMLSIYTDDDDFILVQRVIACPPHRPDVNVRRPHRILFDAEIEAFFLYLTAPGALARFDLIFSSKFVAAAGLSPKKRKRLMSSPIELENEDALYLKKYNRLRPRVQVDFCKVLPFMSGGYARSMALTAPLLVSSAFDRHLNGLVNASGETVKTLISQVPRLVISLGPNVVSEFAHRDINKATKEQDILLTATYYSMRWNVKRGSMNDLFYHNGWWYVSQTNKCSVSRQRRLKAMSGIWKPPSRGGKNGKGGRAREKSDAARKMSEKVIPLKQSFSLCRSARFGSTDRCKGGGTPYFFSAIGNRIYFPYIFGCSGIYSFVPDAPAYDSNGTVYNNPTGDVKHHFGRIGWTETLDDLVRRGLIW